METITTLKTLSKASGYSISTISKALNDKLDVGNETKKKIQNLAKTYNYVPNVNAKALRLQKTKTFAVIVPKINDKFVSEFLSEFQMFSYQFGYRLFVLQSFGIYRNEAQLVNQYTQGQVDGLLIISDKRIDSLSFAANSTVKTLLCDNWNSKHNYRLMAKNCFVSMYNDTCE